jgi:hypothetical protein
MICRWERRIEGSLKGEGVSGVGKERVRGNGKKHLSGSERRVARLIHCICSERHGRVRVRVLDVQLHYDTEYRKT